MAEGTLKGRADHKTTDPANGLEARDFIWQELIEGADNSTRARLHGLKASAKEKLVTYLQATCPDSIAAPSDAGNEILVEAAKSWLDEEEQERRGRDRADPRR